MWEIKSLWKAKELPCKASTQSAYRNNQPRVWLAIKCSFYGVIKKYQLSNEENIVLSGLNAIIIRVDRVLWKMATDYVNGVIHNQSKASHVSDNWRFYGVLIDWKNNVW